MEINFPETVRGNFRVSFSHGFSNGLAGIQRVCSKKSPELSPRACDSNYF
jgi:hypothetical protein